MDTKQKKLYDFYVQCTEKGYSDMQDATQSLKAKVIATDLEIPYKDISKTYEQAKRIFEEERKRMEHAEMLQNTPGDLLVRLEENENKNISVYKRADGSIYYTHSSSQKYEGLPSFEIKNSKTYSFTYHPSETIFTGASSGGIAMGGFHQTKAYTSASMDRNGKGYIQASGVWTIDVDRIVVSNTVYERFKRNEWFKRYIVDGKYINCFDPEERKAVSDLYRLTLLGDGDAYSKMGMVSQLKDRERLSISACARILRFLDDVFCERYPEDDESIYQRAIKLENAATSAEIKKCIDLFAFIRDYKDSAKREKNQKLLYEEVLQREKEEAILRKEAKEATREEKISLFKKRAVFIVPLIIAIVLGIAYGIFAFVNAVVIPAREEAERQRQEAEIQEKLAVVEEFVDNIYHYDFSGGHSTSELNRYVEEKKEYDKAIAQLEELGDSPAVKELLDEVKLLRKEPMYHIALWWWEEQENIGVEDFKEILKDVDYKDSAYYVQYYAGSTKNLDELIAAYEQLPLDFLDVEQRLEYFYALREMKGTYKITKSKVFMGRKVTDKTVEIKEIKIGNDPLYEIVNS